MSYAIRNLILVLLLAILTVIFAVTPIDIWVQNIFYSGGSGQWIINKNDPVLKLVFYDGPKLVLIILSLGLILFCVAGKLRSWDQQRYRGARIVLASLILVPALVGALKATTNMPCPTAVEAFGGDLPHISVFEKYPEGRRPDNKQRCFPAGHASGGFALMALPFLFRRKRAQHTALVIGVSVGWTMGLYKMMIGDHFISHTITTMLLAWTMIDTIALIDHKTFGKAIQQNNCSENRLETTHDQTQHPRANSRGRSPIS